MKLRQNLKHLIHIQMEKRVKKVQQKMMKFMPLAFGFFFFVLSAGVNLYMVTSSLVGIAQQWYLMKNQPLPSRSPFKNKPAKA